MCVGGQTFWQERLIDALRGNFLKKPHTSKIEANLGRFSMISRTMDLAGIVVVGLIDWCISGAIHSRAQAALSMRFVMSTSARGRVKKKELPLPNWLSAQMVPP
jgi:Flp pilus assembly protein TadB